MKIRPSLWIFSPFGQPSYCTTSSHSPFGSILKILPNGMSTHHRLPLRSNDGPSRKQSTAAPWRFGSDQAVRCRLRNFAGSEVKVRTSVFFISWKGLCIPLVCQPPRGADQRQLDELRAPMLARREVDRVAAEVVLAHHLEAAPHASRGS